MARKTHPSKKQRGAKSRAAKRGKQNNQKGQLLEEIAATMYRSPRLTVERNAALPPVRGTAKRTRDIDLLLTSRVVPTPARRAVECKNLGEKVDIDKIDAFIGKLLDVGIPHQDGVYISPHGYTSDAIDRAVPVGMKLLTLTGLTEDRLAALKSQAFQFCIFYMPRVTNVTVTNQVATITNGGELMVFFDDDGKFCGTVADLIWNRWQEGEPGMIAGEHTLDISVPPTWHQVINGKREPVLGIKAEVQVWALVLQFMGESTDHLLISVPDAKLEMRQVNASFHVDRSPGTVHQLKAIATEAELEALINARGKVRLSTRSALPRIDWLARFFYPLSQRVAQMFKQHFNLGNLATLPEINIVDTEGTDLASMWDELVEGYPGKRVPIVIAPDSAQNEVVDVTGLLRTGDFKRVIEFESRLRIDPRPELIALIHEAYLLYGLSLLGQAEGKSSRHFLRLANRALLKVRRALVLNPKSADAHHDLGVIFRTMQRHEQALKCFNEALALEQERNETLALKAKTLMDLRRYEEALGSWDLILVRDARNIEALYFRGSVLGTLDRFAESVGAYDEVLKLVPEHAQSWHFRGLGMLEWGHFEEALRSFDTAARLGDESADLWSRRGRALQALGRHNEAFNNYDRALALNPDLFDVLINRGSMLSALGRYEEALESFDRGLEHQEGNNSVWNTRGTTLQSLGRLDEAVESYDRALTYKPDNRMVLMNRGLALAELGRFEEAIVSYNEALKLEPQHIATLHSRGLAFYRSGYDAEALSDYDQVIALRPNAVETWACKALVLAELERWEEALTAADNALRFAGVHDDRIMLILIRAQVLFLAGRHEDATSEVAMVWETDPERVVSLSEIRELFTRSYDALISVSNEKRLALIEMLFADAVEAKVNGDLDRAAASVNRGVEIYTQVKLKLKTGSLALQPSDARSHDFEQITRLIENLLSRSTERLNRFRDEDFAQSFFFLSKVDAEAA